MSTRTNYLATLVALAAFVQPAHAQNKVTSGLLTVAPEGALQYSIPIRVPAGTNGLQPKLSLSYDSRWGNGALGVGWSVTGFGLSMITRCPKTKAQDGMREDIKFEMNDAYCLDGRRLIPVKGINGADLTEYRTEIDSFSKIISRGSYDSVGLASGGPTSFEIHTKSGLTMYYGGNSATVLTMGNPTPSLRNPIRGWALGRVLDQAGNQMLIFYTNESVANKQRTTPIDDGVFYPTSINYVWPINGNIGASVYFTYQSRSEAPVKYQAGYALPHADVALQTIKSWSYPDPDTAQAYVSYGTGIDGTNIGRILPNRAALMQECDDQSGGCLAALKFAWESRGALPFQFASGPTGFPGTLRDYDSFFVDVNGDGKKFWLQISKSADEAWVGSAMTDGTFPADRWTKYAQSMGSTGDFAHFFADIDGDGKADWIRVSRTLNEAWRALGAGNGTFQSWVKIPVSIGSANTTSHYFADLNGDGRADWIQNGPTGPNQKWLNSVALSSGSGEFQFWTVVKDSGVEDPFFVDLNGDGMIDKINVSGDSFYPYLSNGDGTFTLLGLTYGISFGAGTKYAFADVNGDGNADAIGFKPDTTVWKAYGTGKSKEVYGQKNTVFTSANGEAGGHGRGDNIFADIDGDGMIDRISMEPGAPTGSAAKVMLSSGAANGSATPTDFNLAPPGGGVAGNNKVYLADVNGDGKADLIMVSLSTNQSWVAISQAVASGKIVSISNEGFPSTDIVYKPISDRTVYTPDSDGAYPLRDTVYPMQVRPQMPMVVASVSSPNGIGSKLTRKFTYGGGKVDLGGRGFMGMRWTESLQVESGLSNRNEFRLDWPYTGLPTLTQKLVSTVEGNRLLTESIVTYGCTDFATGACVPTPGIRYFPFVTSEKNSRWDLNGAVLPTVTKSFQYDDFGNITRSVVTSSDGFIDQTDTVYSNDTTKWWLGRPTRVTVTKTSP